jgi:hypothetical protein
MNDPFAIITHRYAWRAGLGVLFINMMIQGVLGHTFLALFNCLLFLVMLALYARQRRAGRL